MVKNKTHCTSKSKKRKTNAERLDENTENSVQDTKVGKNFLDRTSIAQKLALKINRWGYMKIIFCTAQEAISRVHRQPRKWEKTFPATFQTWGR